MIFYSIIEGINFTDFFSHSRVFYWYLWLIMDAVSRSVIGYRVSNIRGVGPCILAMRMAFKNIVKLPKTFKFIADGYCSASST